MFHIRETSNPSLTGILKINPKFIEWEEFIVDTGKNCMDMMRAMYFVRKSSKINEASNWIKSYMWCQKADGKHVKNVIINKLYMLSYN